MRPTKRIGPSSPERQADPMRAVSIADWHSSRLELMRRIILLMVSLVGMVLVLLWGTGVEAGHPESQANSAGGDVRALLIDGERLDFEILYGSIPAGRATLEVKERADSDGEVYRIVSRARSNSVVSLFFEVNDVIVSEVDAESSEPLFFEKRLREGPLERDEWAVYEPRGVVKTEKSEYRIEPGTRDILSALYYVRGHDLEVGDELVIKAFEGGRSYDARIRVLRRETVSTGRGDYDCLVIEPDIVEGVFAKTGRLLIWLTDDALKIPVLVKSKVAVGSFIARLIGSTHGEGV
jgi:hypothetical protein